MRVEGGCYCGALRYKAEGEPMMKGQCHCRECQYVSGGAPNIFLALPEASFSYTRGTPKTFIRSDLERPVTREFCERCGTHVLSRAPGFPAVIIKVGTLDNPKDYGDPRVAIYTVDKQSFHQVPAGVPAFERLPG